MTIGARIHKQCPQFLNSFTGDDEQDSSTATAVNIGSEKCILWILWVGVFGRVAASAVNFPFFLRLILSFSLLYSFLYSPVLSEASHNATDTDNSPKQQFNSEWCPERQIMSGIIISDVEKRLLWYTKGCGCWSKDLMFLLVLFGHSCSSAAGRSQVEAGFITAQAEVPFPFCLPHFTSRLFTCLVWKQRGESGMFLVYVHHLL